MKKLLAATLVLAATLFGLLTEAVVAQQTLSGGAGGTSPPRIVPLNGSVVLDGRLNEGAWADAIRFRPRMHRPVNGAEPSERTEFRITHDGDYLYFACYAFDSSPGEIRAVSLKRDETGFTSDRCALFIDSTNGDESAVAFYTNPAGQRSDYLYSDDGNSINSNWDSFWEVETSEDQEGWYAEMRIPFSSLVFETEDGEAEMGVGMLRVVSRKNEMILFPEVSDRWSQAWGKSSLMPTVVLAEVNAVDPVYITPYVLGGDGFSRTTDPAGNGYDRDSEPMREVGLDIRYNLTTNLSLDFTVNTDFAQVEVDPEQVNLTRFSLFFPEKRRFFQERASTFEYSLGGQERLFHSRRVGLAEGDPVRIYGGARVVGRIGEWDVGILGMRTAASDALPSENHGVVRLRRRVLNSQSYAGGILTSRLGRDGTKNVVYGLDGLIRLVDQEYLTVNWAQAFDDRLDPPDGGSANLLDRTLMRVSWERRGNEGFTYGVDLSRVGSVFEPRMGFLLRRDYSKASVTLNYGWRPGAESPLFLYGPTLTSTVFQRNSDGTVETAILEPSFSVDTKSGHTFTVDVPFTYESIRQDVSLPQDADNPSGHVPVGDYRFLVGRLSYEAPSGNRWNTNLSLEAGQFFDGRQLSISLQETWSASRHFTLDGSYQIDRVEFPDRDQDFTSHIGQIRMEVMLSTSISLFGFVQYNSIEDGVKLNFRFRFNPREGNDLYIVWNEGLVTDPYLLGTREALSTDRAIMVKYAHTLRLGL